MSCGRDAITAVLVSVHDDDVIVGAGVVISFTSEQDSAWSALPECVICAAESYIYLDLPYVGCNMCLGISSPKFVFCLVQELFEFISEDVVWPDGLP